MQSSNIPSKIPLPFANAGTKRTIPTASQIGITPGAASLTDGFPPVTFTPIAAGGVPPAGADFNGIFNVITAIQQWQSAGGMFPYEAAFAAAIGGYPKGAILMAANLANFWVNQTESNSTNPDTGGAGWTALIPSRGAARFTANGSWTCPPGVTTIWVTASAGGGGGGGSNGTANGGEGGGGGAGLFEIALTVVPGTAYPIVVGIGGTAGAAGNSGGIGGVTSMGTLFSLGGGVGGSFTGQGNGNGGSVSLVSGGSPGGAGADFFGLSGGPGGGSILGAGGGTRTNAGQPGVGYGGGGGGGTVFSTTAQPGGAGAPGIISIKW